tara:strand:- start:420 stop:584 length:165 start_codon:yes stop_codon:yes gene_type:complete
MKKLKNAIFLKRARNLKSAAVKAKDPEWKTLWARKLKELIRNERARNETLREKK